MFWENFQTRKKKHLDIVFNQKSKSDNWSNNQYIKFLKDKNFLTFLNFTKNIFIVFLIFSIFFVNNQYTTRVEAPIGYFEAKATSEEEKKQMEKELANIEAQIAIYEKELANTTTEKSTLQNAINRLRTQANSLSLKIKSAKNQITSLTGKISDTETAIEKTLNNINSTKNEISSLLQAFYEISQKSHAEIILANNTLSDYFTEVNSLGILDIKMQERLQTLNDLHQSLNNQKTSLNTQKGETQHLLQIQLLQQEELDRNKKEQENLLKITQNKEATYQQILSEQRKKAAELRSRIYNLVGIQTKVTFGEALDIANWVGGKIGVRPALILSVLTQESNLGQNVGTCNRPTDPPNKHYSKIMHPTRDIPHFLEVTKELGMDPNSTPVSCPMFQAGKQVGWGGAMGPAQFIPSTWKSYKNRVGGVTGRNPANPWDIRDAFVACALYLSDYGAKKQTYDGEWRSAMIYFSGSTNTRFRFYGDQVMERAKKYQADIDAINKAN